MRLTVKPCADLDEFRDAVFAIGQYFALDPGGAHGRFSQPSDRAHARRAKREIVGGAGAFPFEMTVPGASFPAG